MTKPKAPAEDPTVECAAPDCSVRFAPQRSTAKYHSATCRQRAGRSRKAADRQVTEEAKSDKDAEHGLVRAVRAQLAAAHKLDTVNGQLALELARRAVSVDSNLVAMSKELDARLTAAIGSSPAPSGPTPSAPTDAVAVARAARERKQAAAGQAPAGRA